MLAAHGLAFQLKFRSRSRHKRQKTTSANIMDELLAQGSSSSSTFKCYLEMTLPLMISSKAGCERAGKITHSEKITFTL